MEVPLIHIHFQERSWIARLAAKKLGAKNGLAIVFFRTIYLHGISKAQLIANKPMLQHEIKHVLQYQEHGGFMFLMKYLFYSIKYGYYQNPFEIEARLAEKDDTVLQRVKLED